MNRRIRIGLTVFAAAALAAVSCTNIDYLGKTYPPTANVDVYYSMDDIEGEYEIMGHLTATAGTFVGTEKMQEKIVEKARASGADAVVILGLDHYVKQGGTSWTETTETKETASGTKTTTSGSTSSGDEEIKEIRAQFIKYK